jgi:hypothetical protein
VPRIAPRFLSACRLAPEQNVAADCWHRSEYPKRVKVEGIHNKNRGTYRGYSLAGVEPVSGAPEARQRVSGNRRPN